MPATAIADARDWILQQAGAYGHTIQEEATPADLAYVLSTDEAIANYNPEILEGEEIIESFDPGVGDDEMT